MKLEDEIKQKSFKNEDQKLVVNLLFTTNWINTLSADAFKKHDITSQQYNILRILRGQGENPSTINLLKDRMLDKMSDVSRLVERLRAKELLIRNICNNDRRKSEIFITQNGLDLLEELDKHEATFTKSFTSLSEKEKKSLNNLLDKLRG